MNEFDLDLTDRRILNALQIEPRVAWAALAPVIGVDAATISRRWHRIREEGIAWITGHGPWLTPSGGMALVEISCEPSMVGRVIDALRPVPAVTDIYRTTGARDLFIAVRATSIQDLWEYIHGDLARVPGIRTLATHLVSQLSSEGSAWRLRELSSSEESAVPGPPRPRPRAARSVPDEIRGILEYELGMDGRASATAIASRWGLSNQRVTDAIAALRTTGMLNFRTDVSRSVSGWPVCAWYFVAASADTVPKLRSVLAQVPEIRAVAITASKYNLIMSVWVRDLASILQFEIAFEHVSNSAHVADRSVVAAIVKQLGHVIGEDGLATGEVVPIRPAPERLA